MKIGIYCAGSLGLEILSLLLAERHEYDEILFLDDVTGVTTIADKRIVSFADAVASMNPCELQIVIASGEPKYRKEIYERVRRHGFSVASLFSRRAYISPCVNIGCGSIVFPNTYIGTGCVIKENVLIHAGAKIVEGCVIDSHSFISLGAFVGSRTNVNECCFIGPNAAVSDHLVIGAHSVVGMGAIVLKDVDSHTVNVGNPSRTIKSNYDGTVFK